MNSPETQSRHSVQRLVRPCRCEFQKKSDWGYILFEWVGEPKYWRPYARHRRLPLAEAEKRARQYKHVLISCGGCGADIVREYGPNDQAQRPGHTRRRDCK